MKIRISCNIADDLSAEAPRALEQRLRVLPALPRRQKNIPHAVRPEDVLL